ncbi:MAG: leucine-rich repeat domain-containing protein [Ruminococcaceae bacterium]|nr:leucine-rich repeat domain-containing protein [Oscillospiraceae bacterium]
MNKKILIGIEKTLLIIVLLVAAAVLVILTYRGNYDINAKFVYTVMDDGAIMIDGYTGDTPELTIPDEIDGYTVKYIGKEAFANDTVLKKVTIPDSVEIIYDYAFSACVNLKTVKLSGNLKEIGLGAFFDCSSLKTAELPNRLEKIDVSAFENCKLLKSLKIPQSCAEIGTDAFLGCENLILDCSENNLAQEIAKKYNIPTDFSESSESTMIKAGILIAVAVICVFVLPPVIKKIIISAKNKNNVKKSETKN